MLDSDEWTLLRIRRTTKQALERVRLSMETGESMGLHSFERDRSGRVGLDQVIMRLVEFKDKHAERSRRSRNRRKSKAATDTGENDQAGRDAGENDSAEDRSDTGDQLGSDAGDGENRPALGSPEAEIVDPE